MTNAIKITRARENNLKDVSLTIPKHKITVFTGVSGAGKSSLVFDTIAAESQRQLAATFTNYLPLAGRPDADAIENLTASIVVNQKQLRGNKRSTVGTITEIFSLIRLLYSRIGEPHIGYANAFSFNESEGMCPKCNGLGVAIELDLEKLLDRPKSLSEGAINFPVLRHQWQRFVSLGIFDGDQRLSEYPESKWDLLLYGNAPFKSLTVSQSLPGNYTGLVETFNRRYIHRDITGLSDTTRQAIDQVTVQGICPQCAGTRLNPEALTSKINGINIAQMAAMEVSALVEMVKTINDPVTSPIVSSIIDGLNSLISLGLGYLTLDRHTMTLSTGEAQRIKMVRYLGSSLTDLTYIFDEPTIGLHPRDTQGLVHTLRKFRDLGNTVLVVEHDPDVIEIADHIVDLGPGAGIHGGEITYQGNLAGLHQADTPTGQFLRIKTPVKTGVRKPTGMMAVTNASRNNLRNCSVNIPAGVLTVITGVAGAGKSSLMEVFLEDHPQAIFVDQSPIRTSTRSITATYTSMMDGIRDLFAQSNGVSKSLFSFNSEGACPNCQGLGTLMVELPFMDPVRSTCEVCRGKRYREEVLQYTLQGKSILQVLEMSIQEGISFFNGTSLTEVLESLGAVGLGYLTLGQPLSSFSGGECQRLKLAGELSKSGEIYVLDEPTISLHMADVQIILSILNHLVDEGNSVIVIEHNLEIVKNADWVIDLGPQGGSHGGEIIFEGTPRQLQSAQNSYTAEYLRK